MNPVVLATVAISLLAVGTVSMSSLAAQQATSSAGMQKVALERDRLEEQLNAYISAVVPSSSNTKATIKNTGSSLVTIDHCLALSPSGTLRPTAVKVHVGQNVHPGASLDIVIGSAVSSDGIKCVTSKGTVLPVRLLALAGGMSDPADYIDSLAVIASVTMSSTERFANSAYTPWAKPSPPSQGQGSLTYQIPVSKPITVNYVAREGPHGTVTVVVPEDSQIHYGTGQLISVPITGPTSKVTVKFTPQGSTEQLAATIRPNFVDISSLAGNTKASSGSATIGVSEGQRYNPTTYQSWTDWVATYSHTGSGASGLVGANGWIRNPQPSAPLLCSGSTSIDGKGYCANMPTTLNSSPEIVHMYSFPAPKSTVKVTLYYDTTARLQQLNCHIHYCNGSMRVALDLGEGGIINTNVARTDNYGRSCPYSNFCYDYNDYYYAFAKSASATFMLTGLVPGQQVDIPVKLKSSLSSDNSVAFFNGYRYEKGAIYYTGSMTTQLFID